MSWTVNPKLSPSWEGIPNGWGRNFFAVEWIALYLNAIGRTNM